MTCHLKSPYHVVGFLLFLVAFSAASVPSVEADGASEVSSLLAWLIGKESKAFPGGSFTNYRSVLSQYQDLRNLLVKTINCEPGSRFTVFVPYNIKGDTLFKWTSRGANTVAKNTLLAHIYEGSITLSTLRSTPIGSAVGESLGVAAKLYRTSNSTAIVNRKRVSFIALRSRTPSSTWSFASTVRYPNVYKTKSFLVHVVTQRLRTNVTKPIDIKVDTPRC